MCDWRRAALGVEADASIETCKAAYRRQALQTHPDVAVGSGLDSKRFRELNEAYRSLLLDSQPLRDMPQSSGAFQRVLRSRTTTLWLCGASLVTGVAIFAGALAMHNPLFGKSRYTGALGEDAARRSALVQAVEARRAEGRRTKTEDAYRLPPTD